PTFVQRLDGNLVSLSDLPENILFGNLAIFQNQFTGTGSANAEFVFLFADCKSRKVMLHEKSGDSFVTLIRAGIGKNYENTGLEGIRYPELSPIQNEVIPFIYSPACQRKCVAAGPGLAQCISTDEVFRQFRQIFLFLSIVCPTHDGVIDQRILY